MSDWLFRGDFSVAPVHVPSMVLALLLAFLCGHVVAWVYMYTHSGLSYSRSFVNSLLVIPTVVALVMLVLGVRYDSSMYFEAALLMALFGFVGTAALAKFLLRGEVIE